MNEALAQFPFDYLTPPELAKLWRCTPGTVLSAIRRGDLQAFTLSPPGSRRPRWRISKAAIAAFEEAKSIKPKHKAPAPATRQPRRDVIQFY